MPQADRDFILGYRVIREADARFQVDDFSLIVISTQLDMLLSGINSDKKRSVVPPENELLLTIDTKQQGIIDAYGELPNFKGQVSRLGIAWWADSTKLKHVRIFADRIHLLIKFPGVPRIIPFGIEPYFMVFPSKHPYHCLKCRTRLEIGEGAWQEVPEVDPLKIESVGSHFLCAACKYEHDNGFRPGIRPRKARHT